MITTVKEALAAGMEIVAVHGDVRIGATEYHQQSRGGIAYIDCEFSLHVADACTLVGVKGYDDGALTWDAAIAKLRETHVEVVAAMRREAAMQALQAAEPKGVR